jgi:formylglycine-generating enzyme required for sulfatase activity
MKYFSAIFTAILLLFIIAFAPKDQHEKELKKAYKVLDKQFSDFVYIPGGAWIMTSEDTSSNEGIHTSTQSIKPFYMSKYEITNLDWMSFVYDIKTRVKGDSFKKLLPDTTKWIDNGIYYNEPMKTYYHRHHAYRNYPVVNVSFEQSQAFCKWLSARMLETDLAYFKNLEVRLPTEAEWEYAARGGRDVSTYPFGEYLRNSKGTYLANFRKLPEGSAIKLNGEIVLKVSVKSYEPAFMMAPVDMYYENGYGLFHMGGNVAEFVLPPNDDDLKQILEKKGITRGGSFFDPAHYMKCSVRDFYPKDSSAHFSRGFRPVLTFSTEN